MEHIPVLLDECINGLQIKPDGIYIDGTLGYGGHTLEILKKLKTGRLIAIDRDINAIYLTGKKLESYPKFKNKYTLVHANFRDLPQILEKQSIKNVDGMLFDFGTSSPQLDDSIRGFSYMHDAQLDMRMNTQDELTAFDIVNKRTAEELKKIFYEFGEERYSKSISNAIVKQRAKKPIETTYELNDVILSAMPAAARREPQHPSKRCFQALRIAVNDELNSISVLLDEVSNYLKKYGRICIISFHSLEDRLVKQAFKRLAVKCICPKDLPVCVCEVKPILKILTKKPITPGVDELNNNPRARSAKLRIAEKL